MYKYNQSIKVLNAMQFSQYKQYIQHVNHSNINKDYFWFIEKGTDYSTTFAISRFLMSKDTEKSFPLTSFILMNTF